MIKVTAKKSKIKNICSGDTTSAHTTTIDDPIIPADQDFDNILFL